MVHTQINTNSAEPAKKKTSAIKIALIILCLLLALLVLKVVLILTAKPKIKVDYVAEYNKITKPENYDPKQNAALDYQKTIESFVKMPGEIMWSRNKWPGDMNESELSMLSEWLDANKEVLGHIKRGSAKPYLWTKGSAVGNSLRDYRPSMVFNRLYQFGHLLTWHAKLEAANGRFESALQDISVVYRLARHLAEGKITMHQAAATDLKAYTVGQIFVILANERLDAGTLKYSQQQLRYEISQNQELDFQCEKFLVLDAVQRMYTDNGTGNGHLVPTKTGKALVRIFLVSRKRGRGQRVLPNLYRKFTGLLDHEQPSELAVYIKLIYIALFGPDRKEAVQAVEKYSNYIDQLKSRTLWQLHSEGIDSDERIYSQVKTPFIKEILPGLYSLLRRYQEQRAGEFALLATLAVLRYKADKGEFPETLEELVSTGYLEELPMDPYNNGPLVYRRTGDDFILYSVGRDFKDDRGVVDTPAFLGRTSFMSFFPPKSPDIVYWPVKRPEEPKPLTWEKRMMLYQFSPRKFRSRRKNDGKQK